MCVAEERFHSFGHAAIFCLRFHTKYNNTSMSCLGQLLLDRLTAHVVNIVIHKCWKEDILFFRAHWTRHKTQTWVWKHFPCLIFSLAVTSHPGCFVWWLLLPCLIKLFKYSLPDSHSHGLILTHNPHVFAWLSSDERKQQRNGGSHWLNNNLIMNITWYHLSEP